MPDKIIYKNLKISAKRQKLEKVNFKCASSLHWYCKSIDDDYMIMMNCFCEMVNLQTTGRITRNYAGNVPFDKISTL